MSIYPNLCNLQYVSPNTRKAKLKLKTETLNRRRSNSRPFSCKISHNFCSPRRNKRPVDQNLPTLVEQENHFGWLDTFTNYLWVLFACQVSPIDDFDVSVEPKIFIMKICIYISMLYTERTSAFWYGWHLRYV